MSMPCASSETKPDGSVSTCRRRSNGQEWLRARFECQAAVLVVTPSMDVARWAAEPVTLGPGSAFCPLVLGPDAVPVVRPSARGG